MKWHVWLEGTPPEEGGDIFAHSAAEAAEKYVEQHDRAVAEFPTSRVVCVNDVQHGLVRPGGMMKFEVMLEAVPRYWAHEIP